MARFYLYLLNCITYIKPNFKNIFLNKIYVNCSSFGDQISIKERENHTNKQYVS